MVRTATKAVEETTEQPAEQEVVEQETVVHEDKPSIESYIDESGSVTIDLGRQGSFRYESVEELADILEAAEQKKDAPVVGQYRFYRATVLTPMPTRMSQVDAEIGHLNEIRRGLYAVWDGLSNEQKAEEYERVNKEKA